jgi:hypothetical protein
MDEKKEKKPTHALEIGSTKLSWGAILAATFLIALVLAAIRNLVVYLLGGLQGIAVPAWEALLFVLRWLGFLLLAGLLILALIGVVELSLRAWRNRLRQEEGVQASSLPRNETVRGDPPHSRVERVVAGVARHYLMDVLGCDPARLTDIELARLRLELPALFRRPEYAAQLNAFVVIQVYELLLDGCSRLERQIELYGRIQGRAPFWQLRRALHVLTRGAMGLSAKQVWQGPQIDQLKANFSAFKIWFWREGWPLLGMLEGLLEARTVGSAPPPELSVATPLPSPTGPPMDSDPSPSRPQDPESEGDENPPSQEATRNPEAARQIVESAEDAIDSLEPWPDPAGKIDALEEAANEALLQDPHSSLARRLLDRVRGMRARLPQFKDWFEAAIARDSSAWSPLLNEAYRASAGNMSPETVEGQAARLYLSRPLTLEESPSPEPQAQTAPASEPDEDTSTPTPVSAEVTCEDPAPRRETDRPHLTVVPSIEPSAAERADKLF